MTDSAQNSLDFVWKDKLRPFQLTNAELIPRDLPLLEQMDLVRWELKRRDRGDIVAGAIPFNSNASGIFWIGTPEIQETASVPTRNTAIEATLSIDGGFNVREVTSRDFFLSAVKEAVALIRRGLLDKVVLSRTVEVVAQVEFNLERLIEQLMRDDSTLPFVCRDGGGYLVGASPEVLVSKRGVVVESAPLAGSAGRFADSSRDRSASDALMGSQKDRDEHAFVVEDIVDRLSAVASTTAEGPYLFSTNTIWHLKSTIRSVLGPTDGRDSLDFARLLHPTAAVCGSPREAAQKAIREIEGRDRGFYTGAVGWQNGDGDGDWRIILRAASLSKRRALLDVGAGIVRDSEPMAEFSETEVKLIPMLQALRAAV